MKMKMTAAGRKDRQEKFQDDRKTWTAVAAASETDISLQTLSLIPLYMYYSMYSSSL